MRILNSIVVIILMALTAVFFSSALSKAKPPPTTEENTVNITAYNTYIFGSSIRVKCDWIGANGRSVEEKSKWKFMETYYIPKKSKVSIKVPKDVKKCQIWGKLGKFRD
jgi:hypothetical protein